MTTTEMKEVCEIIEEMREESEAFDNWYRFITKKVAFIQGYHTNGDARFTRVLLSELEEVLP